MSVSDGGRQQLPARHDDDHGAVEVVPYDPAWATEHFPRWERHARAAVAEACGEGFLMASHHIGSTAVPGLPAKPIVDMLFVVPDVAAFDAAKDALQAAGFVWCGERVPGGRYLYAVDPSTGKVGCHLHVAPGPLNQRSGAALAFRDALRHNDAWRDEYAGLKEKLAKECGADRGAYGEGKTAFVMKVLRGAAAAARPPA